MRQRGSNVACPSMVTTNDMPIVLPKSYETMAIVPFQINRTTIPKYLSRSTRSQDSNGESRPEDI